MTPTKKVKIKDGLSEEQFSEEVLKSEGELTVDVYETATDFVVLSTVAGLNAKDIDIQVDKDMLVIKGCRPSPDEGEKNYFYKECYWGPFSRKIILPENIDGTKVQAEFNKGLLYIKFPKTDSKPIKGISVQEG